ncbi:hypothetical protein CRG98_014259 [Punica granatum]|uniref:Uncharacterized protein n=1 Tax=Punica granatum TaxID=22663 RepID=A0A2I0K9Z6_PUNGR|nr:hypothetical protein CRG98_014259 [Punica granatum]
MTIVPLDDKIAMFGYKLEITSHEGVQEGLARLDSSRLKSGPDSSHSIGSQRLPVNLRGTFTENRDRNDSRTPRDIQRALRKPWSQVPRPSRAKGLRPEATRQRSPTGQKGPPKRTLRRAKSNLGPRTLNSTPNVRTGQNQLLRRRVARTSVHTT